MGAGRIAINASVAVILGTTGSREGVFLEFFELG